MEAFLNSPWPVVMAFGWVALVVAASILRRLQVGKPIVPKPPADAIFVETRTSGHSLKTWWTQIGSAKNCLLVAVTPTTLVVTPQFPFNLMFLPEVYGLEFIVPRQAITSVETRPGVFKDPLIIKAGDQRFELRLRDPEGFRAALGR